MRDIVVDIAEPVFVFNLTDYPVVEVVDEVSAYIPAEPGVVRVESVEEIMRVREAARRALEDGTG